jgi:hypothetical protein
MTAQQLKILKAAQAKWNAKRDASGKGVSQIGNGVVVRDGNIIIGRVSYNGRMWDANGNEVQA